MDSKEITKFMECLEGIYRYHSITRYKVKKYLGMEIYFWYPGELLVTMVDYLKGVLEDLPEVITGRNTSPAANNLFQVRLED